MRPRLPPTSLASYPPMFLLEQIMAKGEYLCDAALGGAKSIPSVQVKGEEHTAS